MEFMTRNNPNLDNGISNNDIRKKITSINDNNDDDDEDDDDIGENYDDDFSENVSREVKYFYPKQSQPPSSSYFSAEKPRVANRFSNFH